MCVRAARVKDDVAPFVCPHPVRRLDGRCSECTHRTPGHCTSPPRQIGIAALVESGPTVLGWGSGFDAPERPGSSPRPQERPVGPTARDRGRETGTSKEPNLAATLVTLLADGQHSAAAPHLSARATVGSSVRWPVC
jgi:hypothetical protein